MKHRLALLGAVSPGMASLADPSGSDLPYTKTLLPGGIAGAAGALYGLKRGHPFLGFIAAETVGQNAYRLYRGQGNDRTIGLCNVAQSAAIVTGALLWKKHPFYGGLVGLAVGLVATSFVKGSNANRMVQGFRE